MKPNYGKIVKSSNCEMWLLYVSLLFKLLPYFVPLSPGLFSVYFSLFIRTQTNCCGAFLYKGIYIISPLVSLVEVKP